MTKTRATLTCQKYSATIIIIPENCKNKSRSFTLNVLPLIGIALIVCICISGWIRLALVAQNVIKLSIQKSLDQKVTLLLSIIDNDLSNELDCFTYDLINFSIQRTVTNTTENNIVLAGFFFISFDIFQSHSNIVQCHKTKDHEQDNSFKKDTSVFLCPVNGSITSFYGTRTDPIFKTKEFHQGIDIANTLYEPIHCACKGTVLFSGNGRNYGNMILIEHADGYQTRYGHLHKSIVKEGQSVTKGQVIGYLGNTGKSTGPHLHFEIKYKEKNVDPIHYLLPETEISD
jgi:murein DD-endopeptidase MepM/ murein hydrolase activator NlpD